MKFVSFVYQFLSNITLSTEFGNIKIVLYTTLQRLFALGIVWEQKVALNDDKTFCSRLVTKQYDRTY